MDKIDFKKQFGQNFIFDTNLLRFIVESAGVTNEDDVIEIGAGAGTLTNQIALKAKSVISFEIDKSLTERLQKLETEHDNLKFVFEDFMQVDLNKYINNDSKFKVVANIPYYITTPIIFKLLDFAKNIDTMMFMVQKEVAERFCAECNNKDYGITSVILQSIADVKYVRTIKRECFTPAPNVDSALIRLDLKLDKYNINNRKFFVDFVHNAFAMRRKTLVNNLLKSYNTSRCEVEKVLHEMELNLMIRPENISVDAFVDLSNRMEDLLTK
ncbi:MAG: ribosomal RNA small subunit methyltransferase A [Clostridia bacterium]|nr:ribosomal RNA small subunit methyltransferase A [Clostridia bacterium]